MKPRNIDPRELQIRAQPLLRDLRRQLGDDWMSAHGSPELDLTRDGCVMVEFDGTEFFHEPSTQQLIVARWNGPSREFGRIVDGVIEFDASIRPSPSRSDAETRGRPRVAVA